VEKEMKINAKVTVLFDRDGLRIEVYDQDSCTQFLNLQLSPEQTCDALSRLAHTECQEAEVMNLDRVGKVREVRGLEFPYLSSVGHRNREAAIEECKRICPEGWTPMLSFNSQNTFFEVDGFQWARTSICRWVDRLEKDQGPFTW